MVSSKRGRAHRFAAALTALSLVFGTLPAAAQTAAEKETARAMMKDGRAKRDKGDHKGALDAFAAADGIMKLPTTGLEVGRSQTDLGQLVEARDTFLRVTRHPEQSGEPPAFKDARKEAADLAAKLEDRIPALKLTVTGASGTPLVNIDGSDIATATLAGAIKLNPGSHHIAVTAKGATKKELDVELKEGETKEETVELKADLAAPAPVETPVKVDTPTEAPPPSGTSPLVYVGFGLAGVGIVLGSVTGIIAMSKTNAAKEQCDGARCPPATHADLASARTMATVSTISFAAAAVGLGVGIYGLVASKGSTAEPPKASLGPLRRLEPVVGFGVIGLTGAF